jgi:uncharacterized protein YbbC (DUF1343 family)
MELMMRCAGWFSWVCISLLCCQGGAPAMRSAPLPYPAPAQAAHRVITGAERFDTLLPMLARKRVACVVNHTSLCSPTTHLVDSLLHRGINVQRIFAPEHGFRGNAEAGATIKDGKDERTGLPVVSLYGKKKKPDAGDLADVDIVLFDIQDVGARFYTYISTLLYVMEACAEQDKPLVVLDRPNPNGHYVDGPVLELPHRSFVGIAPLPIVHGCTLGELAQLFQGEDFFKNLKKKLRLSIISCQNYTHNTPYNLPVAPSPNLPDMRSVLLYPSICLFEGTTASLGRGTPYPFQMIGHPDFPNRGFSFVPRSVPAALTPPQMNNTCYGYDLREISLEQLRNTRQLNLSWLLRFYADFSDKKAFFLENLFFDKLAGNTSLREMIVARKSEADLRAVWEPALTQFKNTRRKYLLYP